MTGSAAHLLPIIAEKLLLVSLVAILAFKIGVIRSDLTLREINRLARAGNWYGAVFIAIIFFGPVRSFYAAGAWFARAEGTLFWMNFGAMSFLGLLSVLPTLKIAAWQREVKKFATSTPCAEDVLLVQRWLWLEVAGFIALFVLAIVASHGGGFSPE
jgi:putative membrane protein